MDVNTVRHATGNLTDPYVPHTIGCSSYVTLWQLCLGPTCRHNEKAQRQHGCMSCVELQRSEVCHDIPPHRMTSRPVPRSSTQRRWILERASGLQHRISCA